MIAVDDADGDGMADILISGANNGKETRLYRNTICEDYTEEIEIETYWSYDFFGAVLTESGVYQYDQTLRCGKTKTTMLNLTVLDAVVWQEMGWSNGVGPSATDHVVIDDDYDMDVHGPFDLRGLTINEEKFLSVSPGETLVVNGDLENNGYLTVGSGGSLLTFEVHEKTGEGKAK